MTTATTDRIAELRLVPLWTPQRVEDADVVGDALAGSALPVVEVALRTPAGLGALERLAARGDLLVGAGTVLDADQAAMAADRGAAFGVSPGLLPAVVEALTLRGLSALPGISTPSDAMRAVALGLDRVKLFPAALLGGIPWIEALAAPFPMLGFMPSGGVTAADVGGYLAHPAVFAASGSWMLRADAIAAGDVDAIRTAADAAAVAAR